MARKRFGINFKGFDEMADKIEKLGGGLKPIVEKCLNVAPDIINPKLEAEMAKHRRTGTVEKSITRNESIEWTGTKAKLPVGFDLSKGGFPSIFLMYGTARHAPANQYGKASGMNGGMQADKQLYNAIYGSATSTKINARQKEIFEEEIAKRMGGQ